MLFRSDRKSTRLNSSHLVISYAVFCLKKKKKKQRICTSLRRDLVTDYTGGLSTSVLPVSSAVARTVVAHLSPLLLFSFFFFFNDTATTEIYTLSLHDALPIWARASCSETSSTIPKWPY